MNTLLFGTAGTPHSARRTDPLSGIERIKEVGLDCMELEFVYGIHLKKEMGIRVKDLAETLNIRLTAHGPYYINLNSKDERIIEASRDRIIKTAWIASICGATSITFHAAFYHNEDKERVYEKVKTQLEQITQRLRREGNTVTLRPELTGKPFQFGDLEELIRLSTEVPGIMPCIDFSHYHARTEKENSYKEFCHTLSRIKEALGKESLKNMHIHLSGIEYGLKGEKKHLNLEESDFKYQQLLKAFIDLDVKGVVICESPNLEEDALMLKESYLQLRRKHEKNRN